MTRAKTKRMKQALEGLIMELQAKEVVQDDSNAFPRLITYLIKLNNVLCPKFRWDFDNHRNFFCFFDGISMRIENVVNYIEISMIY